MQEFIDGAIKAATSYRRLDSAVGINQTPCSKILGYSGLNIIGGPTGSGKTTLTNDIITRYSEQADYEVWSWHYREGMRLGCEHLYDCGVGGDGIHRKEDIQEVRRWMAEQPIARRIIALSELRSRESFLLAQELAGYGNRVFCTTVYLSISKIIESFTRLLVSPEEKINFINSLDWVIVQRLVGPHENLVACCEYLRFTREIKQHLLAVQGLEPSRIAKGIEYILATLEDDCCSMLESAQTLLEQGDITDETYKWLAISHSPRNQPV